MLLILLLAAIAVGVAVVGTMRISAFHLLAYNGNLSSANAIDLSANVDGEVSQRNNHYLLSEQYNLLAASAVGNTITEANLLSPTLNSITKFNVNPVAVSTTQPSGMRVDYYTRAALPLPQNEELQFQVNASGTDTVAGVGFMLIATPQWQRGRIPQGISPLPIFKMRYSCVPTLNNRNWSTLVNPTFEQSLRGGTYAVVGHECQGTNLLASRIVFPQAPYYMGRRMRPGWFANNAYGDLTAVVGDIGPLLFGVWGQFTTAELPFIEALGTGTSTINMQGWLTLVRLSDSININYGNQ